MAGFFENLRNGVGIRVYEDMGVRPSNAYATTNTSTPVAPAPDAPVQNIVTTVSETIQDTTPTATINIQTLPQGFGSYLDGILPADIATAAGAFSVSMQQIKNISSIPIEKFAQVVTSLETTKGLNVNGTSVPTSTSLASAGLNLIALGSGPNGTYTMSDFLGCMSGLPYIGIDIRGLIQQTETSTLYDIYKNLYLAVTWERATVSVQYSTYTGPGPDFDTYYHVTGLTITDPGGGYGREGAAEPIITISNGGSGTTVIGTNDSDITNFGRVTIVAVSSAGTDSTSIPTATVAFPPGTGSFSNTIVQDYIARANAEIASILASNPKNANQLVTNWAKTGTQLSIEQRAIVAGLPVQLPLADPTDRETNLAQFPTTTISFVDSVPQFALDTRPHMIAQTLEAIANLSTLGGESLVGMLREARNQSRLNTVGIPLDNNITTTLTPTQNKELIANGSVLGSTPATLAQTIAGNNVTTDPYGYYDPTTDNYYNTNQTYEGNGDAVDKGQADEPGSFAGSLYQNLISPELSAIYTSDVLLPSTYSVQEAIDDVIRCNCDCWDIT